MGLIIVFIIPIITFCVVAFVASTVLFYKLPLIIAIPLGILAAALIFVIHMMSQGGGSTVLELNCGSIILLVLTLLIAPVFFKAHDKAMRHKNRHHSAIISPNATNNRK